MVTSQPLETVDPGRQVTVAPLQLTRLVHDSLVSF